MELVTLTIAVIALLIGLGNIFFAPKPKKIQYTLTGEIEITNNCDGKLASIPKQVEITSSLFDKQKQHIGGTDTVQLAPDPNAPAGTARKIGKYSITVTWGAGLGNPSHWSNPDVELANGKDVCSSLTCPAENQKCTDTATNPRKVPFVNPTTKHDVRVLCSC
jgi:hypothetical protein